MMTLIGKALARILDFNPKANTFFFRRFFSK
jgi:hypothetical protein